MPPKDNKSADRQERIDATPSPGGKPRNITETEAWKSSSSGVKRFWFNYKRVLRDSFVRMSRSEQEDLITKFCMILTLGVTCLLIVIFYGMIPAREFRIFGVPIMLVTAWWAGNNVVSAVVIARMESILNKER